MKKSIFKNITVAFTALFTACNIIAQVDADGCKDSLMFNRMPNFYLAECSNNFNEFELVIGNAKKNVVEGNVAIYLYYGKENISGKFPSPLQIIKNYEQAILSKGGQKVYVNANGFNDDDGFKGATYKLSAQGNTHYIVINSLIGDQNMCDSYTLNIIKVQEMQQEIQANVMYDKINSGTPLALYIQFDNGKSTIKPESLNMVNDLLLMLQQKSDLKISVAGHTDNSGKKDTNQKLSEERAKSVKNVLVTKGISESRILTIGFGQDKPIVANTDEASKAQNRRVEITKI